MNEFKSPIFVITHGRFLKILLKYFCSLTIKDIDNCSMTTLRFIIQVINPMAMDDNISSISQDNMLHQWTSADGVTYRIVNVIPIAINDTSHLSSLEE